MSELLKILGNNIAYFRHHPLYSTAVRSAENLIPNVTVMMAIKIAILIMMSVLFASGLFLLNELLFTRGIRKRLRKHRLSITNNGNSPSIFLLRTIDLPKDVAIRFRMNGSPMVWVTYVSPDEKEKDEKDAEDLPQNASAWDSADSENPLVPNLKDPLAEKQKPAKTNVRKSIKEVGKKAGFFASILSNISALLPKSNKTLQEAQGSLKNVQQQSNEVTAAINTKISAAESLKKQAGQLPGADKLTAAAQNTDISQMQSELFAKEDEEDTVYRGGAGLKLDFDPDKMCSRNFVHDDDVWRKNIGKKDENGGSLIYAQSIVLQPGDQMKVDLEIINLAEIPDAVSHYYKIEVLQIPYSKLHLTAPSRIVSGIVVFNKVSMLYRLLPQIIIISAALIALQLISALSMLLF